MRNKSFPPSAELLQYHPVQHVLEVNTIRIVGWGGGASLHCWLFFASSSPILSPPPPPPPGHPPKETVDSPKDTPPPPYPKISRYRR